MGKLIDPGVGEITDRLTILALKILFGRESGKPVEHFEKEQTALLSKIRSRTLNGPWFQFTLELAAVNAMLWHAENNLRGFRGQYQRSRDSGDAQAIADIACGIQALNDQRGQLVGAINKETGDVVGEEKV